MLLIQKRKKVLQKGELYLYSRHEALSRLSALFLSVVHYIVLSSYATRKSRQRTSLYQIELSFATELLAAH